MKTIKKALGTLFIMTGLLSGTACTSQSTDACVENLNWEEFLSQHDMYWTKLTTDPTKPSPDNKLKGGYYAGAIMGNGLLGTNMYKLTDNVYRLNVGRSDVTEMRKPYGLFNSARLPIGYFTLSTTGNVTKEEMRLSLYNAVTEGTFTTDCGKIEFQTYVHAKENYIIFQTEAEGNEKNYKWDFVAQEAISPRYILGKEPNSGYLNSKNKSNPDAERRKEGDVNMVIQKLVTDSTMTQIAKVYVVAWKEISNDNERRIIATVALEDTEKEALQSAKSTISKACHTDEDDMIDQHKAWWNNFYQKAAFLSFPDTRFESFYWAQYYKFASTTRPGKPIVDLQGVWPTWDTPWTAVWINLNLQLTYSWQTKANMGWLAEPLWESIYEHRDNLRRNVTDVPSQKDWTDAACLGRSSSYDFLSVLPPSLANVNQYEVGNFTWLLYYYWQYCNAYGDDRQMTERLFPMLKSAINLYFHIRTEKDGRYGLPPTASPEYIKDNIGPNSNYDLASLRWGLQTLLAINEKYKLNDSKEAEWRDFLNNLTDYPYDEETGYKVSDKYKFENTSHRHYSHLFMIYPYYMVNWGEKENRHKIELSVNHWKGNQGYSRTGKAAMLLSMGKGDEALEQMQIFMDRFVKANTLYAETGPVIETPLAAVSTLHDFYLQDWGNTLRIFHGMPSAWKNASFANMRALGAFLVDATMHEGNTVYIKIKSEQGNTCRIQTGMPADIITIKDASGREVQFKTTDTENGSIEFPTTKNGIYTISNKTLPVVKPSPIQHPDNEKMYYGDGYHNE